jgi:hypothetical protein
MTPRKLSSVKPLARHEYSVRLAGMSLWDDHLRTLRLARRSAAEPRSMGLQDVHIIDERSGELVE